MNQLNMWSGIYSHLNSVPSYVTTNEESSLYQLYKDNRPRREKMDEAVHAMRVFARAPIEAQRSAQIISNGCARSFNIARSREMLNETESTV